MRRLLLPVMIFCWALTLSSKGSAQPRSVSTQVGTQRWCVARFGDTGSVRGFLSTNPYFSERDFNAQSASLRRAVQSHNLALVYQFIPPGTWPGNTRYSFARRLLDATDEQGRTPLFLAVATNQPQLVTLFLNQGADINARTLPATRKGEPEGGKTALDEAYETGSAALITLLIRRGADLQTPLQSAPNAPTAFDALLEYARRTDNAKLVRLLQRNKPRVAQE